MCSDRRKLVSHAIRANSAREPWVQKLSLAAGSCAFQENCGQSSACSVRHLEPACQILLEGLVRVRRQRVGSPWFSLTTSPCSCANALGGGGWSMEGVPQAKGPPDPNAFALFSRFLCPFSFVSCGTDPPAGSPTASNCRSPKGNWQVARSGGVWGGEGLGRRRHDPGLLVTIVSNAGANHEALAI